MPTVHEMSGGGGWRGGGSGGPWGQGSRNNGGSGGSGGGGGGSPDLEELLRRSQDRLRRVFPRRGGSGGSGLGLSPLLIVVIVIVALGFIGYTFFTFRVEPDQQGVVLRFGEVNRIAQPGLNFRLPAPIETVYTPSVQRVNQITIGTTQGPGGTAGRDVLEESLMLTGDGNIVDLDFSVFWRIKDAQAYLFRLQNPDSTVRAVAESAMREVVGRSQLQPLITQERQLTETAVETLIQQTLDFYGAGIEITDLQLLRVDAPAEVIDAFRDVEAARQDQIRLQNEAMAYANRVEPEARGQAAQITEAAEAYRQQVIAEATGQADRFLQVYAAYREAPNIVRERIYLETMGEVFANTQKLIVPEGGGNILPYLPLQQLVPGAAATANQGAR